MDLVQDAVVKALQHWESLREPEAVRGAVLAEARRLAERGLEEAFFQRLKRSGYGARVRALNSFETICIEQAQAHFAGFEYLRFPELYADIGREHVEECLRRLAEPERWALAVVRPGGQA